MPISSIFNLNVLRIPYARFAPSELNPLNYHFSHSRSQPDTSKSTIKANENYVSFFQAMCPFYAMQLL